MNRWSIILFSSLLLLASIPVIHQVVHFFASQVITENPGVRGIDFFPLALDYLFLFVIIAIPVTVAIRELSNNEWVTFIFHLVWFLFLLNFFWRSLNYHPLEVIASLSSIGTTLLTRIPVRNFVINMNQKFFNKPLEPNS